MEANNVGAMSRIAAIGLGEQGFYSSSDLNDGEKKAASHNTLPIEAGIELELKDEPESEQPTGLMRMEAITQVWTKKWLVAAYAFITLIAFVNSLQQQANFSWTPYVTSAFQKHGLTSITGLVANLVGGVSKLPLSKFIDLCGRPQGFAICLVCLMLSLLMMGECQNVQTYAAAQVFYWTGINGMTYVLDIFIADTSLLKNRMIWIAITGSPYICNTFAGPELGQLYLRTSGWRWGYRTFAIITPFISMPFWAIFFLMSRRADKMGVIQRQKIKRTFVQSIMHWCVEFDVIGLLLICGGFSLFLLPFSLAAYQKQGWASPMIICMIIVGFILSVLFVVWEHKYAPKTFFPFFLMKDRSVVAACFLGCNSWIAFYAYKSYYASYLQVVFGLSVAHAGYICNIYNIVACTWAILISIVFKYTDTYKWAAIVGLPIQLLMTGLLIKFRQPGTHIALLVMVEVIWAMCAAMIVQIEQVAVMAAVPHENIATGLALLLMITSVGGSVGGAISGALWTNIVPKKLVEYLPADKTGEAMKIYGSITVQLGYPFGSPERDAIIHAYSDAQKVMVIVGTVALVPCFIWVAMLKNNRLSEHKSRKGLQA